MDVSFKNSLKASVILQKKMDENVSKVHAHAKADLTNMFFGEHMNWYTAHRY